MGMLGLKIDVDTHQGMRQGVPRLLATLSEFGMHATFFLSIGPDNSGRAILPMIRNPLFLKKMIRTNAVGLYGWKTALYGTLLRPPMIALSFPDIVRRIIEDGHEVQLHAWDHRRWQDELAQKSPAWIYSWFDQGIAGFEELVGHRPEAFGAPSWVIDDRVLEIMKKYKFAYVSCTRAQAPFIHEIADILEIPSDLPCFEELPGQNATSVIVRTAADGNNHVLPVHAEVEGGIFNNQFRDLLKNLLAAGVRTAPLAEIKKNLALDNLPRRRYRMTLLSGRHSPCAV